MIGYFVEPAHRKDVDHLVKKHYIGRWPGVTVQTVGLRDESRSAYIGVIVFALPPKETAKRYRVTLAWELARLFIEDSTPKNTESWFISRALSHVKHSRPDVDIVVSYADPSVGHKGVVYRASNWIYDGNTDGERKTPRSDYVADGKRYSRKGHIPQGAIVQRVPRVSKARFVYWMRGHEKKRQAATR